ncbi:uncharacterized protein FAM241A isoform X4 [Cygnus atratus]|uniref:uncharacterized protein FAM241A isoform X4 n=1 Tax=Cygnus atratus TaxID=8868 RepID=UPI0015D5C30B|nr:uncharacterized protein FAM241A isoform X4 [Cygnus atratus]
MSTGVVCNNPQKAKMVSVPLSILSFIVTCQKKKKTITGRRSAGGHHHWLICVLLYWVHPHSGFPWEGNASIQGRRDPTALRPVPRGGLGYALHKSPQSDERILLDLPISQDNYQDGLFGTVSHLPNA